MCCWSSTRHTMGRSWKCPPDTQPPSATALTTPQIDRAWKLRNTMEVTLLTSRFHGKLRPAHAGSAVASRHCQAFGPKENHMSRNFAPAIAALVVATACHPTEVPPPKLNQ